MVAAQSGSSDLCILAIFLRKRLHSHIVICIDSSDTIQSLRTVHYTNRLQVNNDDEDGGSNRQEPQEAQRTVGKTARRRTINSTEVHTRVTASPYAGVIIRNAASCEARLLMVYVPLKVPMSARALMSRTL
jgi:hypothetical protein